MRNILMTTLLAALATVPASALVPAPAEVRLVAEMPLATTAVADIGVPAHEVQQVVVRLNDARVPVRDTVEIVRYTPFDLVVDQYAPAVPVERVELGLPMSLGELGMVLLIDHYLDAGLLGNALGQAILLDLDRLGFAVVEDRYWRPAPAPTAVDFVYYLSPGYRFDTNQGLFRDRIVVVRDDLVRDTYWERRRDRDFVRIGDRDRLLRVGRSDVIVERGEVRRERDGVPPGHAKHGPGGPHPTPGHVRHHVPGGPPGHADHDGGAVHREVRSAEPRRDRRPAARAGGGERGRAEAGPPADRGGGKGKAVRGGQGKGKQRADRGGGGRGNARAQAGGGRGGGKGKGKGKND